MTVNSVNIRHRKTHLHYIDLVKGLAMLVVIADHSGIYLPPILDYFEVPIFYLISGFLFSRASNFPDFLKSKAKRLVAPYFVYTLVFIGVCIPFGLSVHSVGQLVLMFLSPANYPLWFFKALFWSLLMLWLLGCGTFLGSFWRCALVALSAMAIGVSVGEVSINRFILFTGIPQALQALPFLMVGHMTRIGQPRIDALDRSRLGLVSLALLVGALLLVHGHIALNVASLGQHALLFYPMALLSCFAFLAMGKLLSHFAPLEYFGRRSCFSVSTPYLST